MVGHIGLTPQTATALGGLRAQGRTVESATRLVTEALGVQVRWSVLPGHRGRAERDHRQVLRDALDIPIIGIGAGPADGQVLVLHDLLGITEGHTAKFVKSYGTIGADMTAAIAAYAAEVRTAAFPAPEHGYAATPEAVAAARAALPNA